MENAPSNNEESSGTSALSAGLGDAEMSLPYREFVYRAAVTTGQPNTELMQLLAQAMDSYHNLKDNERIAVVRWFEATYGNAPPNVEVTGLAAASLPQGPRGLPGSTQATDEER